MPVSAANNLRAALISNDPQRVASSLSLVSGILARNPNVFAKVEGGKELEDSAQSFQHYAEFEGAEKAARRIIEQQTPEYQAARAKIKREDVDAKAKKELNINDLAAAFDQVPWIPFTDPKVGFTVGGREEMFSQYTERVKENFINSNGDWALAKKMAAKQVGKTWGVTNINGTATVSQYPPERSAQFAGVENAAEAIAADAIATVKAKAGLDVARKDVWTMPVPGKTAQAYRAGEPTPYQLWYRDKDGISHMIQPGRGNEYVPDAQAIKAKQTEERRASYETQSQVAAARSNPLAEAQAVPPQRRTTAQRELISQESGRMARGGVTPGAEVASAEPFERVNQNEKGGGSRLPTFAEFNELPPQRRPKPTPKTKVADADR